MNHRRFSALPTALILLAVLALLVRCAWQSDDAYITFRTVSNAWAGHGLTWNPGERVQSYTHPLWLLLTLLSYGVTREVYFSMLALSLALTLTAAGLVAHRLRGDQWRAATALLLLASSGAFVDYATSGLENPLLFLLLACFTFVATSREIAPGRRLSTLSLLAAAVGLTRLDALLIAAPALAGTALRLPSRSEALRRTLTGLSPLGAWEIFSVVYYGTPFPNTALAKLNVSIPARELVSQGWLYFLDSLRHDPLTLPVILFVVGLGLWQGRAHRLIAAGIALYLLYVLRIGGDFMSGRFFAAPFFTAVALATATPWSTAAAWAVPARLGPRLAVAFLVSFGLLWPGSRWKSGTDFGSGRSFSEIVAPTGIADERAYYYPTTGLLPVLASREEIRRKGLPLPPYPGAIQGAQFARSYDPVTVWNEAGFFGFFAGDRKHVVDAWALCDPLLARIPFAPRGKWRIGHYPRRIPAGYVETRASGENRLSDPDIAVVWDALVPVVRGPLFTKARWREIWRLNTGYYAERLKKDYL